MRYELPANHQLPDYILGKPELLPTADTSVPSLTDIQYMSLENGIANDQSVLVSAPTSTGKTLIGWWAIVSCLLKGGRAVYLVSHRALAKQKFEEAQNLFLHDLFDNDPTAIVCATGDAVEDASGKKTSTPLEGQLLIATYEKFLGCLSVGGPPINLKDTTFVCDEVQLIGDPNRGQKVELLLTLIKRSGWRQLVGLSAVLSERDSQSLAEWLNLRVLRNPTREKSIYIECRFPNRILSVEATPERLGEVQSVPVERPTQTLAIVEELLASPEHVPIIVFCMRVNDTYELSMEWSRNREPRVQLDLPPSFEIDNGLVRALERRAAFHNAELSDEERTFVEDRISAGEVDVVFATSTLAAGINFPLGSAVFDRWKRWNFEMGRAHPIDKAEFQNMVGRVGRMGQAANRGTAIMSAEIRDQLQVRNLINFADQEEMTAGINPDDFGSLVLQLFAGQLCHDRQTAYEILATTLSASHEIHNGRGDVAHWRTPLENQIDRLLAERCLVDDGRQITATGYGVAVARSGLKPETARYMMEKLAERAEYLVSLLPNGDRSGNEELLTFILTHGALTSHEYTGRPTRIVNYRLQNQGFSVPNPYADAAEERLFSLPLNAAPAAANGALHLVKWASGRRGDQLVGAIPGIRQGIIENTARDAAWILLGTSEVISHITSINMHEDERPDCLKDKPNRLRALRILNRPLKRIASSVGAGLPRESLWATTLELNGPKRRLTRGQIVSLRENGIITPMQMMDGAALADAARRRALTTETTGPGIANLVRNAARVWKQNQRTVSQRGHMRRGANLGVDNLVEQLYAARGTDLEDAFENAITMLGITCEKLDTRGKHGYPDFKLTNENNHDVIVEVKSKENDTALINQNDVTEVISAAAISGNRDAFCVTLCSPGVEPSVPGQIEACGLLSVIEVSDFAEAFLRVLEGKLGLPEIYDWFCTPGMATKGDLPAYL